MQTYIAPDGIAHVLAEKPVEYFTEEEWAELFPPPQPIPPTLNDIKTMKWEDIKTLRDVKEQSGCLYLGKVLDTDPTSVQRITVAVQAAQLAMAAGQPFSLTWTMQDNSVINMTLQEVLGIPVALAQYANHLHETARGLREQIEAAQTAQEVEAIQWPE